MSMKLSDKLLVQTMICLAIFTAFRGLELISADSYESARDLLSGLGLFISTRSPVSGSAQQVVGSQSLAAGTRADHGCVVEVTLIDENESLLGKY